MKITGIKVHYTKYFEWLVPEKYYAPLGIMDASIEIDSEGYTRPWHRGGLGLGQETHGQGGGIRKGY